MGLETKCKGVIGEVEYHGRLHVDSKEITFSSRNLTWSHPVGSSGKPRVENEKLILGTGKSVVWFELGDDAGRWLEKLLNPPTRMKKLGVKDGHLLYLQGEFSTDFFAELAEAGADVAKRTAESSMSLAIVKNTAELNRLKALIEKMVVGRSVWIIWPKGLNEIKDRHVIEFGRGFGMGPGKSCSFDDELTAIRFTKK